MTAARCAVDRCPWMAHARGLCSLHYGRWRRGDTSLPVAPTKRPLAEHGTVSGYARHVRLGEPTCEACRGAWSAYQGRVRADPGYKAKNNRRAAARLRALSDLADNHRAEYKALYAEELTRRKATS